MKLTKSQLRKLIKEEISGVEASEQFYADEDVKAENTLADAFDDLDGQSKANLRYAFELLQKADYSGKDLYSLIEALLQDEPEEGGGFSISRF